VSIDEVVDTGCLHARLHGSPGAHGRIRVMRPTCADGDFEPELAPAPPVELRVHRHVTVDDGPLRLRARSAPSWRTGVSPETDEQRERNQRKPPIGPAVAMMLFVPGIE
jgi:hypothetical protein